jgi:hypothetical protein
MLRRKKAKRKDEAKGRNRKGRKGEEECRRKRRIVRKG